MGSWSIQIKSFNFTAWQKLKIAFNSQGKSTDELNLTVSSNLLQWPKNIKKLIPFPRDFPFSNLFKFGKADFSVESSMQQIKKMIFLGR